MIENRNHAVEVQNRRRLSGKAGRAKAVRRWFKRTYGRGVEAHAPETLPEGLRFELRGNFQGCRGFEETHLFKEEET